LRKSGYPAALSLLSAQVFLVPGSDGGCRAAVEGMACGVPLVVTRRGVLPELVEDGRTGFVIDPGDAEGLAGALLSIVRNPSLGREMSACARSRAEQRHDPIQGARSLLGVYGRLCGTTAY
jgi:glycosyltransferase involved in cell wall biosynthesis